MLWCHKGKNVKFSFANSVHFVITDYSTSTFLLTTFKSTKAVISLHNFGNTKSRKDVTASVHKVGKTGSAVTLSMYVLRLKCAACLFR